MSGRDSSTPLTRDAVREYLAAEGSFYTSNEVLDVLCLCTAPREVRFALGLLALPGWRAVDGRRFENHAYRLIPQAEACGERVSFLYEPRHHQKKRAAIDVVADSPAFNPRHWPDTPRYHTLHGAGYTYLVATPSSMTFILEPLVDSLRAELLARVGTFTDLDPQAQGALVKRVVAREFDWSGLSVGARYQRVRAWLVREKLQLPAYLLPVLARCETSAEMRFAVPILNAVKWRVTVDGVSDGTIDVRFQHPVGGGHHVDFLLGRMHSRTRPPFALDIAPAPRFDRDVAAAVAVERGARDAGYTFERVPGDLAAERGRWWAETLASAFAQRKGLRNRVSADWDPREGSSPSEPADHH